MSDELLTRALEHLDKNEVDRCLILLQELQAQGGNLHARLGAKAVGDGVQSLLVARNRDQVVAALGEAIGVNGADAGRCPGDKGNALSAWTTHCVSPSVAARA